MTVIPALKGHSLGEEPPPLLPWVRNFLIDTGTLEQLRCDRQRCSPERDADAFRNPDAWSCDPRCGEKTFGAGKHNGAECELEKGPPD